MNDQNFYNLEVGAIGYIMYRKNMLLSMNDGEKQSYIDQAANARMRAFINNVTYGMTTNDEGLDNQTMINNAFVKARKDSFGDLEDGNVGIELVAVPVQIGQKESLDLIENLEKREYFSGWADPNLVNLIKTII